MKIEKKKKMQIFASGITDILHTLFRKWCRGREVNGCYWRTNIV